MWYTQGFGGLRLVFDFQSWKNRLLHTRFFIFSYIMHTVSFWKITGVSIIYWTAVQGQINEYIKAPRHWLCAGNSTGTDEFPSQRANNTESVSILWRQHTCWYIACGWSIVSFHAQPIQCWVFSPRTRIMTALCRGMLAIRCFWRSTGISACLSKRACRSWPQNCLESSILSAVHAPIRPKVPCLLLQSGDFVGSFILAMPSCWRKVARWDTVLPSW